VLRRGTFWIVGAGFLEACAYFEVNVLDQVSSGTLNSSIPYHTVTYLKLGDLWMTDLIMMKFG